MLISRLQGTACGAHRSRRPLFRGGERFTSHDTTLNLAEQQRPGKARMVAAGALMPALAFTPWQGALAGLALGTVSSGKTLLSSRILGISGAIKGILNGDVSTWRWLFLGGMLGGAALVSAYMPGALETLPETYTLARAAVAGLLVGTGSYLGNGCTSGHGIAGNARLSRRSIVYTLVFMAAGAVAVATTGTMEALQVAPIAPLYAAPSQAALTTGATILGTAVLGTAALAAATQGSAKTVGLFYEAFAGVIFSLGLGFSEMTRPDKVAAFLAVTHPAFNPSLLFVLGSALVVALPVFQLAIKQRAKALDGTPMCLPTSDALDPKLIVGGVLFGLGWGIGGFCPGPALVALVRPGPQILTWTASMIAGMFLAKISIAADTKAKAQTA